MWKGSMFSDWNGEQFARIWQIKDLVEVKYQWFSFKFHQIWIVPKYRESAMKMLLEASRRW